MLGTDEAMAAVFARATKPRGHSMTGPVRRHRILGRPC
ncbi:hypothetical protein MKSMC1_38900 [Mycobacterium kansasii]|nr:hypothetical protein MKSMC1_38900 [Mycobacterium kansasii]